MPVGAGFADQIGAMNMVYGILSALYWRERSGKGQEIKVDLLSGMLAHQGQEMLTAMNFGEDFERPNSGIGHPGMDAPFGVYPTSDGWVTIAMSPYKRLVGVLGDDSLLVYDDPRHAVRQARRDLGEARGADPPLDHQGPARGDARRRHLVRRGQDPS